MDADWSPVHPAVFATVDCTGVLDVWNLNQDTEVPCARAQLDGRPGLNTCRFHSSGSHVAVGDMDGRIYLYDLNEVMVASRANDWNVLSRTIEEARAQYKESTVGSESGPVAVAATN